MTIDDIDANVAFIQAVKQDPEQAHSREDALYHAFVEHVATHGNLELRNMAQHVLETQTIDFLRFCA